MVVKWGIYPKNATHIWIWCADAPRQFESLSRQPSLAGMQGWEIDDPLSDKPLGYVFCEDCCRDHDWIW